MFSIILQELFIACESEYIFKSLLTIQTWYSICTIWCATFKDLGNIIYPLKVIGLSLMFVELSILRCSHGAWLNYPYLGAVTVHG